MKQSLSAACVAAEIVLVLCVVALFVSFLFGDQFGFLFEPIFYTSSFGVCICALIDAVLTFISEYIN